MNPTVRLLFAFALVTAGIGLAASDAVAVDPQPTKSNVPRPPGLNDPGVSTTASAPPKDATNGATDDANKDPLAPVAKPDARLARDKASRDASATAERVASSDVTTRKQGNDTVQEYREHGHVWMIKIVPQSGTTQTFMDNGGGGRLVLDPREGPISPVYYTLYEWK